MTRTGEGFEERSFSDIGIVIADALLTGRDVNSDALTLRANHKLLHLCLFRGDLIGIDILHEIGTRFRNPSTGPLFKHGTQMQTLFVQDSNILSVCLW